MRKKTFWSKLLQVLIGTLVLFTIAAIIFFAAAYRIYYSSPAADLPCRGCGGEAQAVRVNGFDLFYRELGSNTVQPPVVVVHGGPGMSSQTFKNSFDFLSAEMRVIYYDQRGSGSSQIKPDPGNYTIDLLVEELETLRREVIRTDHIILIGHSAGGALVQRYALEYPEHVAKMVLVSSIAPNNGVRYSGPWLDAVLAGLNVLAGNLPPESPEEADAQFQLLGYQTALPRLYDPNRSALLEDAGYVSFVTNREVTRSTMGGDFDPALRQLGVETLLIYGAADSDYTGEAVMAHLDEVLPNAALVRFEKSGHWPFLEEPEKFQQVLADFLK